MLISKETALIIAENIKHIRIGATAAADNGKFSGLLFQSCGDTTPRRLKTLIRTSAVFKSQLEAVAHMEELKKYAQEVVIRGF